MVKVVVKTLTTAVSLLLLWVKSFRSKFSIPFKYYFTVLITIHMYQNTILFHKFVAKIIGLGPIEYVPLVVSAMHWTI